MLKKFEVSNFKSFKEKLSFDLTQVQNYDFNLDCISEGVCKKAIIYGANGSGKSNLGLAIFDIMNHASDYPIPTEDYINNYQYSGNKNGLVKFTYVFQFLGSQVEYSYIKEKFDVLIFEEVKIDGQTVIHLNRQISNQIKVNLEGTVHLTKEIHNEKLSALLYVKKNANLNPSNYNNQLFIQLTKFIDGMVFHSCAANSTSRLFPVSDPESYLVEYKKVKSFEQFLNDSGIEVSLEVSDNQICFNIDNELVKFKEIASSGTKALMSLYMFLEELDHSKVTFFYVDEFDAYYHHELSKKIIQILKKNNVQVIVTTHNTSIMTTDLMRPDCYFIIHSQQIKSLPELTEKELRLSHNLEKLYRSNAFEGFN